METKLRKPYTLKKYRPSPEELIKEYLEGATRAELGLKYKLTGERIRQIMLKKEAAFIKAKKIVKDKKKKQIPAKYAKQYAEFKEIVIKHGRIPGFTDTQKEMVITDYAYSRCRTTAESEGYVFKKHFQATINSAIRKEELLKWLKELAAKLGHTPGIRDINAYGKCSGALYVIYFGSLCKAQKIAGLKPNKRGAPLGNTNGINNLPHLKQTASSKTKAK